MSNLHCHLYFYLTLHKAALAPSLPSFISLCLHHSLSLSQPFISSTMCPFPRQMCSLNFCCFHKTKIFFAVRKTEKQEQSLASLPSGAFPLHLIHSTEGSSARGETGSPLRSSAKPCPGQLRSAYLVPSPASVPLSPHLAQSKGGNFFFLKNLLSDYSCVFFNTCTLRQALSNLHYKPRYCMEIKVTV